MEHCQKKIPKRNPSRGSRECVWVRLFQPQQFRGPIAGMQDTTRSRTNLGSVEFGSQFVYLRSRPRIEQVNDGGSWLALRIHSQKRMPKGAHRDGGRMQAFFRHLPVKFVQAAGRQLQ